MSDKAKPGFTPGKWTIDYDESASPNIWFHAKGNSGIAKIEVCDYLDGKGHRLTPEDWANARLIAQAPAMYEALAAKLHDCRLTGDCCAVQDDEYCSDECLAMARVIAAVKGEKAK